MKKIIIHGGCGAREDAKTPYIKYHEHLNVIITRAHKYLLESNDAISSALFAAGLLEDDPIFNAGTGSRLQQDGQIRMSASVMDSIHNKFAAVVNIQNVQYPSAIAHKLMGQHHSILGGEEATKFAHDKLDIPIYNPVTEHRYQEYLESKKALTGTIGVVALDDNGVICTITSTGGVGFEIPGRIGDTPTVAGNFASNLMGISCTGIGEHIINQAVAAKTHTRVKDGMALKEAVERAINESDELGDYVGLIALDNNGEFVTGSTKIARTLYAYHDGEKIRTFYED
ncbi:MAG: ans [Burkholderiales bacterium]|jgi:L-asparaginase|nr:ans [Burkholderiales bacterium]